MYSSAVTRALPLLVALLLAAPLAASRADAQPAPCGERPNALVADLGQHVVNLGYQRTLGCYAVAQASAGLYVPWIVNRNVLGQGDGTQPNGDVAGLVLRARVFVFPLGTAPSGLWVSPFVQAGPVTASRRGEAGGDSLSGHAFAAGITAGWTFRLGRRFLLGLGFGGQYHRAVLGGSTDFPGFGRFATTVDINVSWRF